jgi:hypothetical protein
MVSETFEYLARYVWPAVLAWNVYLFRTLLNLRLKMAEEYSSKADIEKMFADFGLRFSDFETRFDKRLDERFSMFEQIIKK